MKGVTTVIVKFTDAQYELLTLLNTRNAEDKLADHEVPERLREEAYQLDDLGCCTVLNGDDSIIAYITAAGQFILSNDVWGLNGKWGTKWLGKSR